MAISNQERLGKAMELLREGLAPWAEREFKNLGRSSTQAFAYIGDDRNLVGKPIDQWDVAALLKLVWEGWNDTFSRTLGRSERSYVQELRDWRNKWAHQEPLSSDDTDRALDSMSRLLAAISATEAEEIGKMKMELRRQIYDEQRRGAQRKAGGSLIEAATTGSLKPWREVVTPHNDVATGRYQQAEFAADLWQVHLGEGTDEYRKPAEFFRRTYLTESLRRLLVTGVQRLASTDGDPVVQLQTNFGGGKTHSMLALYHLFSGVKASELPGVDTVLAEAGVKELPTVRRVVLVGNKLSPGNPATKKDGTVVRTLWGELAWQLGFAAGGEKGAKKAFARVAADDERATSPGDTLRELFNELGPCLVLIDEWVAYARQLHDQSDLPGGSFETHFTFAQALTESAKLAKNCLLVISLPASDTSGSPHTQSDDVEVGGVRGREALDRLRNVIGRLESAWRPATAEEGFEIVRRRLFEEMPGNEAYRQRDLTARAFAELYRNATGEFPPESRTTEYEERIKSAYPIHPEIFDRLYGDWSTLIKFQRTRGVLRLMAAVIHNLWERGDRNPLILPATIPIDDPRVQPELTRYLSDNWAPIIEKDVDGPGSLPAKIDAEVPNLGKYGAARRVARTVYLGSAPSVGAAHRGIEDRRIKLGCVMPGESPAMVADALRRLTSQATYLYQDGPRVWYDTQPTVTKLADDRAEQLKRDPDKIAEELERRLRIDLKRTGDFDRVHPLPRSGAEVPDDLDARLVVLAPEQCYSKGEGNLAEDAARGILESRGTQPRLYRNTLMFLAADKVRLQDLEDAARKFLAWQSIVDDADTLSLTPHQARQAKSQCEAADGAVRARIPEAYQWLLVPTQPSFESAITWTASRLTGNDPLAARASKKLRSDESLVTVLGATTLRGALDKVLWRGGNHIPVRQLVEDYAQYLYLDRLSGPEVLLNAVRDGLSLLTWRSETFAYAERFDEATGKYRGLRAGQDVTVTADSSGLLVRPDVAGRQLDETVIPPPPRPVPPGGGTSDDQTPPIPPVVHVTGPTRFHGSVVLDSARVGRDASRIAEEVIAHLAGLVGADVTVTLEIDAEIPDGAPEHIVRTVTENSRTLKFRTQGFERE